MRNSMNGRSLIEPLEGRRMMSAAATTVVKSEFSDNTSVAEFDSFDASGTVETRVSVQSSIISDQENGQTDNTAVTSLTISIFDHSVNQRVLFATGALHTENGVTDGGPAPAQFTLDPNLKSAHLHAAIDLYDETHNATLRAAVDLTWNAAGGPTNTQETDVTTSGGITDVAKISDLMRNAVATGSVTNLNPVGSYPAGTNFIPAASVDAYTERDSFTETLVTRSITASVLGTTTPIVA